MPASDVFPAPDIDVNQSLPVRTTSPLAIISLVTGILGWFPLPIVASLVAIVTGHMARSQIRRNPAELDGDGFAVVGLVLGWSSVAVYLLVIAAVVLFFGGLAVLLGWLGLSGHLH